MPPTRRTRTPCCRVGEDDWTSRAERETARKEATDRAGGDATASRWPLNPFLGTVTPTHRGGPRGARVSRRDLRATRRCIRVVVMGP